MCDPLGCATSNVRDTLCKCTLRPPKLYVRFGRTRCFWRKTSTAQGTNDEFELLSQLGHRLTLLEDSDPLLRCLARAPTDWLSTDAGTLDRRLGVVLLCAPSRFIFATCSSSDNSRFPLHSSGFPATSTTSWKVSAKSWPSSGLFGRLRTRDGLSTGRTILGFLFSSVGFLALHWWKQHHGLCTSLHFEQLETLICAENSFRCR